MTLKLSDGATWSWVPYGGKGEGLLYMKLIIRQGLVMWELIVGLQVVTRLDQSLDEV